MAFQNARGSLALKGCGFGVEAEFRLLQTIPQGLKGLLKKLCLEMKASKRAAGPKGLIDFESFAARLKTHALTLGETSVRLFQQSEEPTVFCGLWQRRSSGPNDEDLSLGTPTSRALSKPLLSMKPIPNAIVPRKHAEGATYACAGSYDK